MLPFLHGMVQDVATTVSCVATDSITTPAADNTFIHEADMVWEFTVNTISTSGSIILQARKQDNNNYWWITITTAGRVNLYEVVSGSPTARALNFGSVSGGEKIVFVFNNETITAYEDGVELYSYSSAVNFKTETDGYVQSLGTGGSLSNLVTWPYPCGLAEVGLA